MTWLAQWWPNVAFSMSNATCGPACGGASGPIRLAGARQVEACPFHWVRRVFATTRGCRPVVEASEPAGWATGVPESGNCSTGHTQRDACHFPLASQQGGLVTPLQEGWPLSGGQRGVGAEAAWRAPRPSAARPPVAEHKSTHALCTWPAFANTYSPPALLCRLVSPARLTSARLLPPAFPRPGLPRTAGQPPTSTTHPSSCRFS